MNNWIGVDLDGTLAYYDRWISEYHIGAPIWPMVGRVSCWIAEGKTVKIFTARVHGPDAERIALRIQDWLESVGLPRLEVTNVKDYGMIELWDDRAVQVQANTGEPVGYSTRGL